MLLRSAVVLIFILLQLDLLDLVMDTSGDVLEQPQIGPQSLDSQSGSEVSGAWSFCALVRGEDWDPSVFTRVLNDSTATDKEKLFEETQILSYACRDRSTVVPHGFVPVEGYLKCKGSKHVRRGTLRRRLKHPDLTIEWTAIRIGRERRYTDHDWIQTFHRETALPPTGVLQYQARTDKKMTDHSGDRCAVSSVLCCNGNCMAERKETGSIQYFKMVQIS